MEKDFDQLLREELVALQRPDPIWLSALRGRLSGAVAALAALGTAGAAVWEEIEQLRETGLSFEAAVDVITQVGLVLDTGETALVTLLLLWTTISTAASKLRERKHKLS